MGDQRKRQRTESMIKMAYQKRESKLWHEEANNHLKSGNLEKSIFCYNKITILNMSDNLKVDAEKRLNISRDTELLQSFVRINVDDDSVYDDKYPKTTSELLQKKEEAIENEKRSRQSPMSPETSRKLSKQLTQEGKGKGDLGKKKRRRLAPRQEELYCDKDRAAAVNMGTKDIKQSLKLKRKQDRSKLLQIPEEAEPSTFLALGNYEMIRGDLQIAVAFMSKALELNPTEKNSLVARSKCYILLGQPQNALKDAETALMADKGFIKAIYQKAEALYYLGDFEHSLMYFHRGLHIRPDHEEFKLGVHKAQKAIENAIGSIGAFPLGLVRPPKSRAKSTTPVANPAKSSPGSKTSSSRQTPECNNNTNRGNSSVAKSSQRSAPFGVGRTKSSKQSRLLRELGADKEYLDNLMHNPDIKCKYKENDTTIEKCIQETVEYLNARQEFWRQQLPAKLK